MQDLYQELYIYPELGKLDCAIDSSFDISGESSFNCHIRRVVFDWSC